MARTRTSLATVSPRRSAPVSTARIAPRHARAFGRARRYEIAVAQPVQRVNDELRQYMMTFLGGFVFVAVFLA